MCRFLFIYFSIVAAFCLLIMFIYFIVLYMSLHLFFQGARVTVLFFRHYVESMTLLYGKVGSILKNDHYLMTFFTKKNDAIARYKHYHNRYGEWYLTSLLMI